MSKFNSIEEELEAELKLLNSSEECERLISIAQSYLQQETVYFQNLIDSLYRGESTLRGDYWKFVDLGTRALYKTSFRLSRMAEELNARHEAGEDIREDMKKMKEEIKSVIASMDAICSLVNETIPSPTKN